MKLKGIFKFYCAFFSLVLMLTLVSGSIYASSDESLLRINNEVQSLEQSSSENNYIDVDIITVDSNLSKEDISRLALDTYTEDYSTNALTTAGYRIFRSGDTTTCQLSIFYFGGSAYQNWRYKLIDVKSTSILSPVNYKTFGNGVSYTYLNNPAAPAGVLYVGNMNIPTNVDRVRITHNDLQAFSMNSASWNSVGQIGSGVDIN